MNEHVFVGTSPRVKDLQITAEERRVGEGLDYQIPASILHPGPLDAHWQACTACCAAFRQKFGSTIVVPPVLKQFGSGEQVKRRLSDSS